MNWLEQNWQTIAALGIVATTIAIFAVRLVRAGRKGGGCGGGCECGSRPTGETRRRKPPR